MKSTGTVGVVGAAIAACLTVGAGSAAAYTVRPPELQSYLGQPLRMHIRIELDPGESPPEQIQLASQDDIARLGLESLVVRNSNLRLRREDGSNAVEVYVDSPGGLSEPMFAIVLELRRGDLRTLHQVTVMLDPPPSNVGATLLAGKTPSPAETPTGMTPATAAALAAIPPAAPTPAARAHSAVSHHHVRRAVAASAPASHWSAGTTYGPVRHGETLSGIARKVRADRHVSINELVKALVVLNPRATHGSEDFVAEGATLNLPRELTAAAATPSLSEAQPLPVPTPAPMPTPVAAMPAAPAPAQPSEVAKTTAPVTTVVVPPPGNATATQRFQMATSLDSLPSTPAASAPAISGTPEGTAAKAQAIENPAAAPAAVPESTTAGATVPAAAEAAPASSEQPANASAPETATGGQARPATPASPTLSDNMHSIIAATPSVGPVPQAQLAPQPRINLFALGGLGALLAAAAAGLFLWARRGGSAGIGVRESAVLTPKGANDSVSTAPFDIDAALAERKRTGELTNADRVVLLKQAYAARGKRVRDINQG